MGKSASGKDYFKSFCQEKGLDLEVSYTTRPKRPEEIEGITYHYISKLAFLEMTKKGEFYEFAFFNNEYYGTLNKTWQEKEVFIMTPGGIREIKKIDRKDCAIIYFDIDEEVRRLRLKDRSDNNDSIERRIEADEQDFKLFKDFDLRVTDPYYDASKILDIILKMI